MLGTTYGIYSMFGNPPEAFDGTIGVSVSSVEPTAVVYGRKPSSECNSVRPSVVASGKVGK